MPEAAPPTEKQPLWREVLLNRRMLICVFTGFSSGLPLYLLINLLPAWLRSERDRALRADPAAVHLEVPVVAAGRSLCPAPARPAARLDARHAIAAARIDSALRPAAPAARSVDHRVSRARRRIFRSHAGHRARRVSSRAPARSGARTWQRDPRPGLPHLEPGAGRSGTHPRRSFP